MILHNKKFQALEASWRGLWQLANAHASEKQIKIKVLNISARELNKDLTRAIEFDQSHAFKLIYSEELDKPGGEPFGVIIGNYAFSHQPTSELQDSISILKNISYICSQAFTPFISSIHTNQIGIDHFYEIKHTLDISNIFQQKEYDRWRALQSSIESRFIGLTLPRVLMRQPYNHEKFRKRNKFYKETILRHSDYLWGNPCFSYANVLINCFKTTGWLADIRGVTQHNQNDSGGTLTLSRSYLSTDAGDNCANLVTDLLITDQQEKQLSDLGFLPLQDNAFINKAIFYSAQSLYQVKKNKTTDTDLKINSMLHYILCASRFAHYIKVIMREKIGSFVQAEECERYINLWLNQYCATSASQSAVLKSRYPLREAKIKIKELSHQKGNFQCDIKIAPHYQLDEINTELHFTTKIRLS